MIEAYNNLHVIPFRFMTALNDGHTHSYIPTYAANLGTSICHNYTATRLKSIMLLNLAIILSRNSS